MPSRNEKVNIVIGAKDQASSVLSGVAGKVAAIGAAYLAWGTVTKIIGDTIRLGSEAQQVWGDVAASLDRHGYAVDENKAKIEKFADEMQTLSGISDETIAKAVQGFLDFGNTVDDSLSLTRTAMDLAAGSGMDLKAAMDLLGKASVGYTGTLSRYGIIIDESIPKSEKFAQALQQINERFGGAAAARADNFATKMSVLTERIGDAEEKLFTAFSDELTLGIQAAADAVAVLGDNIGTMAGSVNTANDGAQTMTDKLVTVGAQTKVVAQGFLSLTQILWNAGSAAKNIIEIMMIDPMLAFGTVAKGVLEAIATYDITKLTTAMATAAGYFKTDVEDIIVDIDDMKDAIAKWGVVTLNASIAMGAAKIETDQAAVSAQTATTEFNTMGKVIEGSYQKLWALSAGPQMMIEDYAAINAAYEAAGVAVMESWTEVEKKTNDAQAAFGQFTGNALSAFSQLRQGARNIWQNIFLDFSNLLLKQILTAVLPGGPFVSAFLSAFNFWDVAANDRALIREGNRAAMFIMQGLTDGVRRAQPAINTAVGYGGGLAVAGGGGSQSITINFNGPITDRDFIRKSVVPEIERSIRDRGSRIKMDSRLSTGVAGGELL